MTKRRGRAPRCRPASGPQFLLFGINLPAHDRLPPRPAQRLCPEPPHLPYPRFHPRAAAWDAILGAPGAPDIKGRAKVTLERLFQRIRQGRYQLILRGGPGA